MPAGLVLSARDAARFCAASRALLSPLEHETVEAWGAVVNDALCELFGAQRAALVLPRTDQLQFVLRDFDGPSVEPFEAMVTASGPGTNRYADRLLDHAMSCVERAGIAAWTTELVEHMSGIPSPRIPFFQEVLFPGGLAHMAVMGAPHDHGMAISAVFHDDARADVFGGIRLELMQLLSPAFEAGVRMLERRDAVCNTIGALLDDSSAALMVFNLSGRELHRNVACAALLRDEPESARLLEMIRALAGTVARLAAPAAAPAPMPAAARGGTRRCVTPSHQYDLYASIVGAGVFGHGRAVVISARRHAPLLPARNTLVERFGLTPREADVAIRLALGRSNAEIADELCRSPHTIRHHAEHVFGKLGVHSRKALALRLLAERTAGA